MKPPPRLPPISNVSWQSPRDVISSDPVPTVEPRSLASRERDSHPAPRIEAPCRLELRNRQTAERGGCLGGWLCPARRRTTEPGEFHPEAKSRMRNAKSVGTGSRFRWWVWIAASAGSIPQRPPSAMAHTGAWPAPWMWPAHEHAAGGQAQDSSGALIVAQRREGVRSAAARRMARRKRIWICGSVSPVNPTPQLYTCGGFHAMRLPSCP